MRYKIIVCFFLSSIGGSQRIPMRCSFSRFGWLLVPFLWWHTTGGHPCLWTFNLWGISFGEDIGGKSNVGRGLHSTSIAFYIWCGAIYIHIVMVPCQKLDPEYTTYKKAWKRLLSFPFPEALALPNHVEQTTSEPTPIWIIATIRDLYKQRIVPERIQFVLTRSPQEWCNHPRDIYRWLCSRHDLKCFARFQEVSNRALVNAFIMSGLYFYPPNARFM